jgi:hypothetical protein
MNFRHPHYDPSDFHVPPSLGRDGKSIKLQTVNIQEGHRNLLEKYAHSDVFPFTSYSDVVRFCIKAGTDILHELEPTLGPSIWNHTNNMLAQQRDDDYRIRQEEVFNGLRSLVGRHMQAGRTEDARDLVVYHRKQALSMPQRTDREIRHRSEYLEKMNEWAHLYREDAAQ